MGQHKQSISHDSQGGYRSKKANLEQLATKPHVLGAERREVLGYARETLFLRWAELDGASLVPHVRKRDAIDGDRDEQDTAQVVDDALRIIKNSPMQGVHGWTATKND